jgi:hypothetical protein
MKKTTVAISQRMKRGMPPPSQAHAVHRRNRTAETRNVIAATYVAMVRPRGDKRIQFGSPDAMCCFSVRGIRRKHAHRNTAVAMSQTVKRRKPMPPLSTAATGAQQRAANCGGRHVGQPTRDLRAKD